MLVMLQMSSLATQYFSWRIILVPHTHTHTHARTHKHTRTHTRTHARAHTHTYTHTRYETGTGVARLAGQTQTDIQTHRHDRLAYGTTGTYISCLDHRPTVSMPCVQFEQPRWTSAVNGVRDTKPSFWESVTYMSVTSVPRAASLRNA